MEKYTEALKPSKFQLLMWQVAGSDINVLIQCNKGNVYNKHASIGFTILVTTFFATIIGGVAGFKFGESILVAVAVGLVWGLIIFTIDRNMVIFLRKDPDYPLWRILWAFSIRFILALLISYFIAIPLELIMFKDDIQREINRSNFDELVGRDTSLTRFLEINSTENKRDSAQRMIDYLMGERNNFPRNEIYQDCKKQIDSMKIIIADNEAIYNRDKNNMGWYYNQSFIKDESTGERIIDESSTAHEKYEYLVVKTQGQKEKIDRLKNQKAILDTLKSDLEKQHVDQINEKLEQLIPYLNQVTEKYQRDTTKRAGQIEEFEEIWGRDSFTIQYIALHQIQESSTLVLMWFLRAILFMIELLPTSVKLAGKPDVYDKLLKKTEDELINDYEVMSALTSSQALLNMHTKLEEVSKAQNDLTKALIQKWKSKMEDKIDQETEAFFD